jgi:hypothetical protein
VQRNRSGAGAAMDLTEREMWLGVPTDGNSGMTARVKWATEGESRQQWLAPGQLEALGFDLAPAEPAPGRSGPARQLQRRAFIAFELREGLPASRLVPVDASADREQMLAKYPNRRTHLVTAGLVGLRRDLVPGQPQVMDGYVASVDPRGLHVPTELAERLRQGGSRRPTFTITVHYGSQLEPWIADVR